MYAPGENIFHEFRIWKAVLWYFNTDVLNFYLLLDKIDSFMASI